MTSEAFVHLKVPTIHLNGTSKQELLDQLIDAGQALRSAYVALCEAAPNARDYYPQGNGAYGAARDQHVERVRKIQAVIDELNALAEKIDAAS